MKARVKSTGVLIDVIPKCNTNAQHSGDNLYVCDNMIFRGCDLDFLNIGNSIDWEQRRYEIAKETVTAIMSNEDFYHQVLCEGAVRGQRQIQTNIASAAVVFADALIEELRKGENNYGGRTK